MKKILSFFLCLALLLYNFSICVSSEDLRKGISLEQITMADVTHPDGYYVSKKSFEKAPTTIEAWIYIPKEAYSSGAGVILSNYLGRSADYYFCLEVKSGGIPCLSFGDIKKEKYEFNFSQAAIPADKWTHLTVVYGTGDEGKQVYCYINGRFVQKTSKSNWYDSPAETFKNKVFLSGDLRTLNDRGFRGELGDIAVYSDIRTPDEIKNDFKNAPDLTDENLMLCLELFGTPSKADIPDKSGHGFDMYYCRYWLTEEEMQEIRDKDEREYSYTLAFIPDTQYMTELHPDKLGIMFDYLVENGKAKGIEYVIGLGDITNANGIKEWETAIEQTNRLNGYLPYSLIAGNHDAYPGSKKTDLFNQYYGQKSSYYYQHISANGGFMDESSVRNTYICFSVGNINYIIINLDFGATDDILAWAGEVLEAHSEHRAILVTHGYLFADGNTLDETNPSSPSSYNEMLNSGEAIWQKLGAKHKNIDMIISGHVGFDHIVCTPRIGDGGNTVYQMLIDPQAACNKLRGIGVIALMYFTEDGNHAKVEYYSTVFERYFCESNKLISLTFGESEEAETTDEETTLAPSTDAPTEPVNAPEVPEETGCGAAVAVSAATLVILAATICFKRNKKDQGTDT